MDHPLFAVDDLPFVFNFHNISFRKFSDIIR